MVDVENDYDIRHYRREIKRIEEEIELCQERRKELKNGYIANPSQLKLFDTHWSTLSEKEIEVQNELIFLKREEFNLRDELQHYKELIVVKTARLEEEWRSGGVLRWLS